VHHSYYYDNTYFYLIYKFNAFGHGLGHGLGFGLGHGFGHGLGHGFISYGALISPNLNQVITILF
jgi:hypothetical protein